MVTIQTSSFLNGMQRGARGAIRRLPPGRVHGVRRLDLARVVEYFTAINFTEHVQSMLFCGVQ